MPRQKRKKPAPQIKWAESYTSLFLGIVVVVIIAVLVFSFVKNGGRISSTQTSSTDAQLVKPTSYIVKENDNLWTIAEKMYGSGYNWVDIVSENKISNPNILYVGQKITIPDVEPIKLVEEQTASNSIKGDTYKVQLGDSLWDISVRAYGDGYKWTKLASENKLTNPDVIHAGNIIKIPR